MWKILKCVEERMGTGDITQEMAQAASERLPLLALKEL
jgi:hypothetical protein